MDKKICSKCKIEKCIDLDAAKSDFHRCAAKLDGFNYICKTCQKGTRQSTNKERQEIRKERLGSDYAALKPEDFSVSVANDGRKDAKASEEKRQEYSKSMGEFAEAIRSGAGLDHKLGNYIGALAEQERATAKQFFTDKITPTGYALKKANPKIKRTVCLLLSDLHLGASMDERGNPLPFREIEEARRFEYLVRQALDYKPQYRENSELLVMLNGDIVDGYLKHDERAGLPLTEQKAVFWHHLRIALGLFSQQYPRVRVECQPGNHGRNIARHPGRATEDKWDGIEWDMYYALSQMTTGLPNVTWNIPFRAVSTIDLYGSKLLLTHGDTEPGFGDPDSKSEANAALCAQINSTLIYGHKFDAVAVGHWHKGRAHVSRYPQMIFNGALVPPNGFARSHGMIGERQGQWIWEAVEGYPVGDARFIVVGPSQDKDERLGKLIPPFRFPV